MDPEPGPQTGPGAHGRPRTGGAAQENTGRKKLRS
ncbi:hypothetical protein HBN54_004628 [Hymenobacter sp. 1B]|uniref:Uncharacterized protein n=1 Tax=Hymenobacter artigasi TaxID=2719616 RepID=A0ABX1HP20_9BACT|nr:hypothetical protein [Hymenobacter artigasi]